jgi:hypothetical protein
MNPWSKGYLSTEMQPFEDKQFATEAHFSSFNPSRDIVQEDNGSLQNVIG